MDAKIRKRDGRLVKFKAEKITNAIAREGVATAEFDSLISKVLTLVDYLAIDIKGTFRRYEQVSTLVRSQVDVQDLLSVRMR